MGKITLIYHFFPLPPIVQRFVVNLQALEARISQSITNFKARPMLLSQARTFPLRGQPVQSDIVTCLIFEIAGI